MKTDAVVSVESAMKGAIRVPPVDEAIAGYRTSSNFRGKISDNVYVKPSSLPPPIEDSGCDSDTCSADVSKPPMRDGSEMSPASAKCDACGVNA